MMNEKVAILGMGYVGLTLAVVLSEVGYEVYGIEINEEITTKLNDGRPHFYEKNLAVRLKQQLREKRLRFLSSMPKERMDVYIISVGTPLKSGEKVPNLSYIDQVVSDVGHHLRRGSLVCFRSTLPVGTSRKKILPLLEKYSSLKGGVDFHLSFTPERTIEGKALEELRTNPQVIGGLTQDCTDKAVMFFQKVTPTVISVSSIEAAEFAKIIDNNYRDVRFAFANEMACIAEQLNLDATEIIQAANIHYKRNNIPVPSPGVGGACLSKDPHILIDLSKQAGYDPKLIVASRNINEKMPQLIVKRIQKYFQSLNKRMEECTFLLVGFAFKGEPETADLRDSTTLWLLDELSKQAKNILGFDPIVMDSELEKLGVKPVKMPEGARGVDAILILNNHRSYSDWDISEMARKMKVPGLFYDGWRMFDKQLLDSIDGIQYMGPGV